MKIETNHFSIPQTTPSFQAKICPPSAYYSTLTGAPRKQSLIRKMWISFKSLFLKLLCPCCRTKESSLSKAEKKAQIEELEAFRDFLDEKWNPKGFGYENAFKALPDSVRSSLVKTTLEYLKARARRSSIHYSDKEIHEFVQKLLEKPYGTINYDLCIFLFNKKDENNSAKEAMLDILDTTLDKYN